MDRVILVFCAVILISQFSFDVVLARRRFDGTSETNEKDEDDSKYSLFSSKQERRKRGSRKEVDQQSDQELAELLDVYEDSPLALVVINGNDKLVCKNMKVSKKKLTSISLDRSGVPFIIASSSKISTQQGNKRSSFIPRPGRNIDDDLANENDKWLQEIDNVAEYMIQRSPPFAPRLGKRKSSLYAPRDGREL